MNPPSMLQGFAPTKPRNCGERICLGRSGELPSTWLLNCIGREAEGNGEAFESSKSGVPDNMFNTPLLAVKA